MIYQGDCLEVLKTLPDKSVDSVVTDPPAGIGFMGKDWDHHKGGRDQWIAWLASILKECNRVLKPGGHALVWSIPRTSHWTGMACEDAGFEVRDQISHIFGSGFPKSHNVSKAIDKMAGVEREAKPIIDVSTGKPKSEDIGGGWKMTSEKYVHYPVGENSCDLAKQWDGWGSALKPSREDWWLVRKPLSEKTLAQNVVKHGTGALNIDGTRIELQNVTSTQGRWPSHTLFDENAAEVLDEQSGILKSGGGIKNPVGGALTWKKSSNHQDSGYQEPSVGGASRFFYVAKASKRERNKGCEDLPEKSCGMMEDDNYAIKTGSGNLRDTKRQNFHPTVKPIKLMEYLIKLITPPGGTVLDPFMGSGSTGVAAKNLGMSFIGIEQNEEYFQIAQKRIG